MNPSTPLDRAHALMEGKPDNTQLRLRFFERLADCELFMLLTEEAKNDNLLPDFLSYEEAQFVLVFDSEERLSQFSGQVSPYAAISGRIIANMLAGQGIGIALNLDVAPSSFLLPAEGVDWLDNLIRQTPDELQAKPVVFSPPSDLSTDLLEALDQKLKTTCGLAKEVWLSSVEYEDGHKGLFLAVIDARPGSEGALVKAAHEAVTFSAEENLQFDVAFLNKTDKSLDIISRQGLRIELPEPEVPKTVVPQMPGGDPDKPPKLH
ncbi:MAG: SseB family protein [Paracoccaceae bacterium]|nr:SseB family protein [Paracoccaceae bacterium]